MTPEYASPEQISGGAVTTSTDVYSLGVVLNEVLTGRRPDSSASGELSRDVENIVRMATRHEPERRYASVDQFAEDIRRYLAGRPVTARPDTFAYRASKFIGRHKGAMVATVLVAIALLAGAGATAWQARRVVEQVNRTERLFVRLRKLANAFLFDFHDRIERMRDVSEARELVLATGMEYIDGLARDAGPDPILRRELARAYEKFGDIYGYRHDNALGQPTIARESYRKAIALLEPMQRDGTIDTESALLLSRCYCSTGSLAGSSHEELTESISFFRQGLEMAWKASEGKLHRVRYAGLLNRAYHLLGDA
jgi:serine/threonine protein kinase